MPDLFPIARFTTEQPPVRIVFGEGAAGRIGAELDHLGLRRIVLITTAGRSAAIASVRDAIGSRLAGEYDGALLHVPIERVDSATSVVEAAAADALVAVGGGSPIGLAKAVARVRHLPVVAVPTTYSGSEMTSIWGITDASQKRTGRAAAVAPRLVVYDPLLTLSLPADVSAASGMNAIAHAVEALYAPNVGPVAAAAADDAIRSLSTALPLIVRQPDDRDARVLALRGAHCAGTALELTAMGLHHKICHVLGGTFGLPHAATHAAVLPHVVAFNAEAAPEAMRRIARALDAADAADALFTLNRQLGVIGSLRALGLTEGDVERAADLVASASYPNPRPSSRQEIGALLRGAL
jgi:maleylacetate reductase